MQATIITEIVNILNKKPTVMLALALIALSGEAIYSATLFAKASTLVFALYVVLVLAILAFVVWMVKLLLLEPIKSR